MNGKRITDTFSTLRSKLKKVASAILRNEDDAEDALQDAFCRLWKRRDELNQENMEPNARITLRYVCLDMLRSRAKQALSPVDENALGNQAEETAIWSLPELQQLTANLLSKLTERQRMAFEMMSEGFDNDIIALRLGISEEAVRQNICRARKTLRNEYRKQLGSS